MKDGTQMTRWNADDADCLRLNMIFGVGTQMTQIAYDSIGYLLFQDVCKNLRLSYLSASSAFYCISWNIISVYHIHQPYLRSIVFLVI